LGIVDFHRNIGELSGGLRKRVALARALLMSPDFLILDEPTNHLDADSVQWLQEKLQNSSMSLMFVTHDRYFLDSVSNRIIEISDQKIFSFPGSYELYLEQKEAYSKIQAATHIHTLSRLRSELA
jgi:ATP-binding cassette subfamily F protein uup